MLERTNSLAVHSAPPSALAPVCRPCANVRSSDSPEIRRTSAPKVHAVRRFQPLHCALKPPFALGTCCSCVCDSDVRVAFTAENPWSYPCVPP